MYTHTHTYIHTYSSSPLHACMSLKQAFNAVLRDHMSRRQPVAIAGILHLGVAS